MYYSEIRIQLSLDFFWSSSSCCLEHELEVRDRQGHWCSQVSFTNPPEEWNYMFHWEIRFTTDWSSAWISAHKLCQCMWYLGHEGLKSCISPQDSFPPINMHKPFQAKMKMKQKTTATKRRALLSFLRDACNWGKWVWVWLQCRRPGFVHRGQEDPLEEGMVTHSSILAWRIPWQRSLVGYSPRGFEELDWP